MVEETANPIGILLIKSDSKGHRLLFRYPFTTSVEDNSENVEKLARRRTPYSLLITEDPLYYNNVIETDQDGLNEFSDELLSTLFAVKSKFYDSKFELKVNNIRFVGYPALIQQYSKKLTNTKNTSSCSGGNVNDYDDDDDSGSPSGILIHIVFALKASADYSIVKSYYELSKRIAIAIRHEEKRVGYFAKEMKHMMAAHDMYASKPDDSSNDLQSSFDLIVTQCSLARDIKLVYENLCATGIVHFRLNNWIEVSFCLTQKAHSVHIPNFTIGPDDIDKCLQNLKPYHGILLLDDILTLLNSLPPDASPSLSRFIKVYSPLKNFQMISADSDLTIAQVYNLIGHLLNWGYAMVIYPLCESNVYVIAPGAATLSYNSPMKEKFSEQFPEHNLLELMHEFSLPSTMLHKLNPLTHSEEQTVLVQIVAWMIRHRLLMQLHTYIYFMPTKKGMVHVEEVPPFSHSRYQSMNTNYGQSGSDIDTFSIRAPSESDLSSLISEELVKIPMTTFQTELNWFNISLVDEGDKVDEFIFEDEFIANLSEDEKGALLKMPGTSSPEDFHLFIRLLKQGYLQGTSHLEEIMYLENIRRSQLVRLIERFQDVLITCECEDPAVSFFYPSYYTRC